MNQKSKKNDVKFDTTAVKNDTLIVSYGTKVGENIAFREYTTITDKDGFYSIELGCASHKAIDSVEIVYSIYDKTYAIPKYKKDGKPAADDEAAVKTDAYFYGKGGKKNLAAGHAYNIDFKVTAESYVEKDIDVNASKVK